MKPVDGGQYLSMVAKRDPVLGAVLQQIIDGVNATATASVGPVARPTPPDGVQVKVAGELAHVSITHNAPVSRGIRYFTEVAATPGFSSPIVIDHGASRTAHPFPLPTKDDSGNAVNYYFRSYAQYPGSPPSDPAVYGGAAGAIAVTMTGSTAMTLLPSTGSGTASPSGQQGGQGMGVFATRAAQGPKRGQQ